MGILRAKRALKGKQGLTSEENSLLDFLDALGGFVEVLSKHEFKLDALPDVEKGISVFQSFLRADAYQYGSMDSMEEFINNLYTMPISKVLGIVLDPRNTSYLLLRHREMKAQVKKIAKQGWEKAPEHTAEIKRLNNQANQYAAIREKLEKDLKLMDKSKIENRNILQNRIAKIQRREKFLEEKVLSIAKEIAPISLLDKRLVSPLIKDDGISEGFYKGKFFRKLLIKTLVLYRVLNQDNALLFMRSSATKNYIDQVSSIKKFASDYMNSNSDNRVVAQGESSDAAAQDDETGLTSQLGALTAKLKQMTSMNIGPIPKEGTEFLKSDKLLPTLLMSVNMMVPVFAVLDTISTVAFGIKPPINAAEAKITQFEKNINEEMTKLSEALGDYGVWTVIKNIATNPSLAATIIEYLEKRDNEEGGNSLELQIFKKIVALAPEMVSIYEKDYQTFPAEFVDTNKSVLARAISKMASQQVTGQQLKETLSFEKILYIIPVHMSIAYRIYNEKFLPSYQNAKTYAEKLSAFKLLQREAKQDFSTMCKPFVISNEIIGVMLYDLCVQGKSKLQRQDSSDLQNISADDQAIESLLSTPLVEMTDEKIDTILDSKYDSLSARNLPLCKLDLIDKFDLNYVDDLFDDFFDEELKNKPDDMYTEQGLVFHQQTVRKADALFELFKDFGMSRQQFESKINDKIGVSQPKIIENIVQGVIDKTLNLSGEGYIDLYREVLKNQFPDVSQSFEVDLQSIEAMTIDYSSTEINMNKLLCQYLYDNRSCYEASQELRDEYSFALNHKVDINVIQMLEKNKDKSEECKSMYNEFSVQYHQRFDNYQSYEDKKSEAVLLLKKVWCDKVEQEFPQAFQACKAEADRKRQEELAAAKLKAKNQAIADLNQNHLEMVARVQEAKDLLYRIKIKDAVEMLMRHHVKKADIIIVMKSYFTNRLTAICEPSEQIKTVNLDEIQKHITQYMQEAASVVTAIGFGARQAQQTIKRTAVAMLIRSIKCFVRDLPADSNEEQIKNYLERVSTIGAQYGCESIYFENAYRQLAQPQPQNLDQDEEEQARYSAQPKKKTPFMHFVDQALILKLNPNTNPELLRLILEESFIYVLRHRKHIGSSAVPVFKESPALIKGFVNDYVQSMLPVLVADQRLTLTSDRQYVNELFKKTILPSLGISGPTDTKLLESAVHVKVSERSLQYLKEFNVALSARNPTSDELAYAAAMREEKVGDYILQSMKSCALSLVGDMSACEEKLRSDLKDVIVDEKVLEQIISSKRKPTLEAMVKYFEELSESKADEKILIVYKKRIIEQAQAWGLTVNLQAASPQSRSIDSEEDPLSFLQTDIEAKTFNVNAMVESINQFQKNLAEGERVFAEYDQQMKDCAKYDSAAGDLDDYLSNLPVVPSDAIVPKKPDLSLLRQEEMQRAEQLEVASGEKRELEGRKNSLLAEIEGYNSEIKSLEDTIQAQNEEYASALQGYQKKSAELESKKTSCRSWSYPKIAVGVIVSLVTAPLLIGLIPMWWFHRDAAMAGIPGVSPWKHMFERMGTLGFRRQHTYLASMEAIKQHEDNPVQKADQTTLNSDKAGKEAACRTTEDSLQTCQDSLDTIEQRITVLSKECEIDINACDKLVERANKLAADLNQAHALRNGMVKLLREQPPTAKPFLLSRSPSSGSAFTNAVANHSWFSRLKRNIW